MCDIAAERERINLILWAAIAADASAPAPDAATMVEIGLTALRGRYADFCSEACMRNRCEAFVAAFAPKLRLAKRQGGISGPPCAA